MKLPGLFGDSKTWWAAYGVWVATLWWLSSTSTTVPGAVEIPFADKVCHFGYFFGGGGLLAAAWYCRRPATPDWRLILMLAVGLSAAIGALDEWHQTHTPGRSGNDPWDWLADVLGGTTGALVFRRCHRVLLALCPTLAAAANRGTGRNPRNF